MAGTRPTATEERPTLCEAMALSSSLKVHYFTLKPYFSRIFWHPCFHVFHEGGGFFAVFFR
jgi:hypothetical protein